MGAGGAVLVLLVLFGLALVFLFGLALLVSGLLDRRSGGRNGLVKVGATVMAVAVGIPLSLPVIGLLRGDVVLELDVSDGTIDEDVLDDADGTGRLRDWDVDRVVLVLPGGRELDAEVDSVLVSLEDDDRVGRVTVRRVAEPLEDARRHADDWREQLDLAATDPDVEVEVEEVGSDGDAIPRLTYQSAGR